MAPQSVFVTYLYRMLQEQRGEAVKVREGVVWEGFLQEVLCHFQGTWKDRSWPEEVAWGRR